MRNLIFYENETFDILKLINKISSSLCARKNIENRLKICQNVEFLDQYFVSLASIRDAMFDPG